MTNYIHPVPAAEILDPEWRFVSTTETPNGVRVEVTITVPERIAGMDVGELGEVAQMCCSRAAMQARNAGQTDARTQAAF